MEAGAYMNHFSVVFSHNPLHDLESLWWVGVWFLLCHYCPNKVGEKIVQLHIYVIKNFGATLFDHRDPLSRRRALIGSAILEQIRPQLFPSAIQYFIYKLNVFRDHLFTYYKSYIPKESQLEDLSFFVLDVHRKFEDVFEGAVERLRISNDRTELWPLDDIEERITRLSTKK